MTAASRTRPGASSRPRIHALGRGPARLALVALALAGTYLGLLSGFGLLWFVPYAVVGSLLLIRGRGGSIGWLLLGLAWAHVVVAVPVDVSPQEIASGAAPLPQVALAVVGGGTVAPMLFTLYFALAVVFPSGELPRGPWGAFVRAALVLSAVLVLASTFAGTISLDWSGSSQGTTIPNPVALAPGSPLSEAITTEVIYLPVAILLVIGAGSLVVRFRRAAGIERQQLRWLVAAMSFVVVAVVGGFIVATLVPAIGETGVQWVPAVVAFPTVPVAIGIAVLRYRLYEIDRLVSRTISYAVVSAVLVAVFAGAILAFQAVLAPFTGGSTIAVAGSTLVVAALFQPVRGRVQRVVDRRFNRARYDAERTAAAFAGRLRDQVELDVIHRDVLATIDAAVRPAGAALWLRNGAGR